MKICYMVLMLSDVTAFYSSSRNTRDLSHEIRARSESCSNAIQRLILHKRGHESYIKYAILSHIF